VDEILASDQVVGFAYVTPARGVVLTPLTNFAVRDRDAGTVSPLRTSIGLWKKLERIQREPRVAIAYHTREHGFSDRDEYVLVQGHVSFGSCPIPAGWSRTGPAGSASPSGIPAGLKVARRRSTSSSASRTS